MLNEYFFKPIDLPPLPKEFINEALNGERNELMVTNKDRLINDNGHVYKNAKLNRWRLSQSIADWLVEQGINGFTDVCIQLVNKGKILGPHTDGVQRVKLFYNILAGGDAVETIWYQEENQTLIREKQLLVSNKNNLVERYRCKIPTLQWGLLNVGIIHEVRGMTSKRESVVASFDDYPDISAWNIPNKKKNI
jgi:hypothetical protein